MAIKILFQTESVEWIDVKAPTREDLHTLHSKYNINRMLLEDTIDPNHFPKYEEVDGIKFFLTRENVRLERKTLNGINDISTKLGFFLVEKTIITVHRIKSKSISELQGEIAQKQNLYKTITPEKLALKLALKVMKSYDDESKKLMSNIDKIETDIFLKNKSQYNPIRPLYKIKRKAGLNMRILSMSSGWISSFRKLNLEDVEIMDLIDKQNDVIQDFDHINNQTANLISMYIALSDQKANQVMKLLAIYSVYFLPITFIAGVYGMNFEIMPELHTRYGYFITLGGMLLIVLATFIYIRRKKF
ncbi:CorA family divalent cation transporter [Riemerella columbipharyngis]|uniref:Magnesium transporter n=1 Tax=Riemerella columbipharyngis TaxID=1071918 RepID=A0A1G7DQL9_9FLAO|nr:CorA family divalent cation transporter [Riemerella columbipharyngis]SDE53768.1 magnesium transporter [Riemerella columbipharyngis]